MSNQFDQLPMSMTARITDSLTQLKAAGWPYPKATSIVAISPGESGAIASLRRDPAHSIFLNQDCWSNRILVALEGDTDRRPPVNGTMILDGWPGYVERDPEAMAWLKSKGYIESIGTRVAVTAGDMRTSAMSEVPPLDALAEFYEWIIMMRKPLLLGYFSVGPTMIRMLGAGVCQAAQPGGGQKYANCPDTWDDVFNWYMSQNALQAFSTYPEHWFDRDPAWPTEHQNQEDVVRGWLSNETGTAIHSQQMDNYYTQYMRSLNAVVAAAAAMGWTQ